MGTVDESHDNVVHTGFCLDRNLGKTLHDLSPSLGPLAVKQPVLWSADRLVEHNPAIEHDDHRALILQRGRVYADSEVVDCDTVLAIGREVVFETDAAARAQRQRHSGV